MYKYGGTYLDSDAVSIRPLPTDKERDSNWWSTGWSIWSRTTFCGHWNKSCTLV